MITLKRKSMSADKLRAYKVVLDGEVVCDIKNGQQMELDVSPGKHTLRLKIDWCGSNTIDFDYDGTPLEFECGGNVTGLKSLLAVVYITFWRNQYLWLRQIKPSEGD